MDHRHLTKVCVSFISLTLLMLAAIGSVHGQTKAAAADPVAGKSVGSKSAPITVEVFSDFQCPACKALYQDTLRRVIDTYVSSGKVYLIHRDMPLPAHKYSRDAARYANAAARLGKFSKVEEALFAKQETWSADGNIEGVIAGVLPPPEMNKLRQMLRNSQLDASIEKDVALAHTFQVQQTPTTIVTHRGQTYPVVGVVSYDVLHQFFDQLLKR